MSKQKVRVWTLVIIGALLMAFFIVVVARLWQAIALRKLKISRQTTYITSPLTRNGGVNYWSFGNFIPGARTPRLRPVWSHLIKRYEWHEV